MGGGGRAAQYTHQTEGLKSDISQTDVKLLEV